jgi:hypothetical protein
MFDIIYSFVLSKPSMGYIDWNENTFQSSRFSYPFTFIIANDLHFASITILINDQHFLSMNKNLFSGLITFSY